MPPMRSRRSRRVDVFAPRTGRRHTARSLAAMRNGAPPRSTGRPAGDRPEDVAVQRVLLGARARVLYG